MTRWGRNARHGRRPARRRSRGSPLGRASRAVLEFLLVLVLLFFAASYLGLLERRHRDPQASSEGWTGENTRIVPALVTETEPLRTEGGRAAGGERLRTDAARDRDAWTEPIRVHLANGSGVNRLAAILREPFRVAGFDVCGTSNADCADYAETVVVDRCGQTWKAKAVAEFVRARWGRVRVVHQVRGATETDILVILGQDVAREVAERTPRTP